MNKKGFTLTELLVVVVILGIITGLSIPLIRNLSSNMEEKKYDTYADSVLQAAKLYKDSYSEDLFGRKEYGCSYITYEQLVDKGLIKDIDISNVSCATDETIVRIIKQKDKYGYSGVVGCGHVNSSGQVLDIKRYPKGTTIPIDNTSCTGSRSNNIGITVDGTYIGGLFDKRKKTTKIVLTSGTGINARVSISTAWSTDPNGFESVDSTAWSKASFEIKGDQEKKLLDGELITANSNQISTPNRSGAYYLLVRVDDLKDLYGDSWKNNLSVGGNIAATNGKYISYGPFKVDLDPPTLPTITAYAKENSDDVTTIEGLETVASNTWHKGWLVLNASGSTDNSGTVLYKYTVTGTSTNVVDREYTFKNIHAQGISTVQVKACDLVGNCSDQVSYIAKLDRTAPNAPTLTGYQKTSIDNVSSSTGLSTIASNTWTKKYLFIVASGSTDDASGGVYYSVTTSGQNPDVTDSIQSSRNVNGQGTVTLKFKACDSVGNCSSETTFISKQDRTNPTCTTSKSNLNTQSGVKVTITCSDTGGSGCSSSNTLSYSGVQANKTYTVKDNVGNEGTCSVSISSYNCSPHDCNCKTVEKMYGTVYSAQGCRNKAGSAYSRWQGAHVLDSNGKCVSNPGGNSDQGCCYYNVKSCSTCYYTCYK